jgi:nucleoid DNA-binding protein
MSVVYKTELVRHIAKRMHLSQRVVSQVLTGLAAEVAASLERGDAVQVTNFGTFYRRPRPAGRVRDFTTGAWRDVPAGTVAAFRAGASLKKAVGALTPARGGRPRLHRLFSRLGK